MIAIATVNDLHCGSGSGLLPPGFKDADGAPIGQNPVQVWLWDRYHHRCEEMWRSPVRAVVVNGDSVDGPQGKSGGYGVMSNLADQRRAAVETIEYLMRGFTSRPPLYFVRGTPYHVGNDGNDEEAIASVLRAEEYAGRGAGHWAKPVLDLEIGKVRVNWSHHLAYSKVNAVAPLGREIQRARKAATRTQTEMPHVILRAHVHQFAVAVDDGVIAASAPCWQVVNSHIIKNDAYSVVDIGSVMVWINPDEPKDTRVECTPYQLPAFMFQGNILPL